MTLPTLPLLSADDHQSPLFWRLGKPISRACFASAVATLAERLPDGRYLINRCHTRYGFCTTLIAAALRGQTCLLPGHDHSSAILDPAYADARTASDDPSAAADLLVPLQPLTVGGRIPSVISAQYPLAIVFTSGSTGQPQPHIKTWGSLWHASRRIDKYLLDGIDSASIVATVPMHHMYGLETTVALPLASHHAAVDTRPVFPEDVRRTLVTVSTPRVLITAPVHIRALLEARVKLPQLARIISATAPLPLDLARRAEAVFSAPVFEIYGCTEAGSIASRRSVNGSLWTPLRGLRVSQVDGRSVVSGDYLDKPVPLHDQLQLQDSNDGSFMLIGRSDDVVKVGGKRASLADLTYKLLSIPGVIDGVVFQPDDADKTVILRRLAALVVAPRLSENEILTAFSHLIDPVFLPRPLRRVEDLPRNATGKLPHDALKELLAHA